MEWQLQQQELQKKQQAQAQRLALRLAQGNAQDGAQAQRREPTMRRRTTCTVRVNNLHAAEAIETDVWPLGKLTALNYYFPKQSCR